MDLPTLAGVVAAHPGLHEKRGLRAVAERIGGDGDDAAVLPRAGAAHPVLAAEAIAPDLVATSPRVAGVAGVVTVLNDLAATGARPAALLDTAIAGDAETVDAVLAGVRAGADRYRVPVVGGHTTLAPGAGVALSTFALGWARTPLRAARARPGDAVCMAACLDGEMFAGPGPGWSFSHLRGRRAERAADDLALLAEVAEAGDAWAARDVSMPGVAGSLLQLAESAGGLGAVLALDAVPRPAGVELARWLVTFPSYGFLLVGDPGALTERFRTAGLACARVGTLDGTGRLRLAAGGAEVEVWDLAAEPLTGLRPLPG